MDSIDELSEEEIAQKLEAAAARQRKEWEKVAGAVQPLAKGEKESKVLAGLILEARQALAKGERELALVIRSHEDCAHVTFDAMGMITGISPGCEKLLGRKVRHLMGKPIDFVLAKGIDDIDQSAQEMDQAGRGEPVESVRKHRRPDGTTFDAQHTVVAIVGALGDVTGYVRQIQDLTNRRILQIEVDELNAALALLLDE